MLPRERVIAQLKLEESDVVPMGENHVHSSIIEKVLGHEILYSKGFEELDALWDGRRDEVVKSCTEVHTELPKALGWDYVRVPVSPKKKEYLRPTMTSKTSWIDENGKEFHFNPDIGFEISTKYNTDMTIAQLPDIDEDFKVDDSEMDSIREVITNLKETHFIIARLPLDGTFPYKQTVGMEELLIRMITDPEFVKRAAEVYVNRSIAYINAFFDVGVDAIMTTDDYADNRGLIMGFERFKEFILPGIEKQVDAAHKKGGYFIKHTDGRVWDALDSLVGIGIDGWHGIQPSIGMDFRLLKEKYGKKLCFFGGLNCETLIDGSIDEVEEEAKYAIRHAAPGGGLVLTSGNGLENGMKFENYKAMMKVREEYGRYPIR
ncbi:MAG: uroporphyrinogen decarboxylase family protein [Clostridia bacterium]